MAKFTFDIEERLVKRVCVEASNEKVARAIVDAMYDNDEIVLSGDDFETYDICIVDDPHGSPDIEVVIKRKLETNYYEQRSPFQQPD